MNPVLEALRAEMNGHIEFVRRNLAMHLFGGGEPRCSVPYAGQCPDSILDAWDAYDDESVPPDTACLCEGGVCRG